MNTIRKNTYFNQSRTSLVIYNILKNKINAALKNIVFVEEEETNSYIRVRKRLE